MQRFVVTTTSVEDVLEKLSKKKLLCFDMETTGLEYYNGDEAFSMQFCDGESSYYFNFKTYDNVPAEDERLLDRDAVLARAHELILSNPEITLIGQNLKYDQQVCLRHGVRIACKIANIEDREKILYNQYGKGKYGLDDIGERYGFPKDASVKNYVDDYNVYETVVHYNGEKEDKPRYDRVPFDIIVPYGLTDVEICWQIYHMQEERIAEHKRTAPMPVICYDVESALNPIVTRMEFDGIRVNLPYVKEAYAFEREKIAQIESEFQRDYGYPFTDSGESLAPILKAVVGIELPPTPEGTPSAAGWVLEKHKAHPIVRAILEHRARTKRSSTYFLNLIKYTDKNGFVHPGFNQRGADQTGRFSGSRPNFQNLSSEYDELTGKPTCEYPVRKAVIPRDDHFLLEYDFKQQEFRLTIDYSGERELAARVAGGEDPHRVTAELTGTTRSQAKPIGFGLMYGMGVGQLADSLGCTYDEAKLLKARFLRRLGGIKQFIYAAADAAKARGFVYGWDGMRFFFPDPKKAYKAVNSIIQGGSATITKCSMIAMDKYIHEHQLKSKIIATVHDSILLDFLPSEIDHILPLGERMKGAYKHKYLPMEVSVEHSYTNWFDLEEGIPNGSPSAA